MKKNHYIAFLIFVFGLFSAAAFAQNPLMYISSTSGYSTIEGSSYNFSVNLYSASTTAVIINVITNAGTANATDYTPLTMTVTIPAGQISTGILSIPTTNDAVIEANETFTITGTVTSGNTSNTTANSNITIVDNDTPPTIFLGGGGVEGVSNSETSINLSNPYSSDIVINFVAIPGTAGIVIEAGTVLS